MRRILGITLALATLGTTAFAAEHKSTELQKQTTTIDAGAAPQWGRNRNDRNIGRGRTKSVTRTRMVRQGRRLYRETYLVRYFPNGRTDTRLISRVRVS
jgi:hypothetical protein